MHTRHASAVANLHLPHPAVSSHSCSKPDAKLLKSKDDWKWFRHWLTCFNTHLFCLSVLWNSYIWLLIKSRDGCPCRILSAPRSKSLWRAVRVTLWLFLLLLADLLWKQPSHYSINELDFFVLSQSQSHVVVFASFWGKKTTKDFFLPNKLSK